MLIKHVSVAIIPQANGIVIPTTAHINKKNRENEVRISCCYSDEELARIFSEWFPGRIEDKLTKAETNINCIKIKTEKIFNFNEFREEIKKRFNIVMKLQQVFSLIGEKEKIIFQDIDKEKLGARGELFLVSDGYLNIFFVIDKTKIIRISITYYSYSVVGFGSKWWMNVEKLNENDDLCVNEYKHIFCSVANC